VRRKVPVIFCDLKPTGKYLAVDLHNARGGIPAGDEGAAWTPACLHGDCITSRPARPSPRT
jgi:dihydroxy-acid dehydratase